MIRGKTTVFRCVNIAVFPWTVQPAAETDAMTPSTNNSLVLPAGLQRLLEKRDQKTGRTAPAAHCERDAAALLRPSWLASSDRLTVLYPGQSVNVDLVAGGGTLCLGQWMCEVRRDNELLRPVGSWREICWFSDETSITWNWRSNWPAACASNAISSSVGKTASSCWPTPSWAGGPRISDYRSRLPLGRGVQARAAAKSWEHRLACGGKRTATVLPLALPEWRSIAQCEELSVERGPRRSAAACGCGNSPPPDGSLPRCGSIWIRGAPGGG